MYLRIYVPIRSLATEDDDSCEPVVYGCLDTLALNYSEVANTLGDSVCVAKIYGCMDEDASNYDASATIQAMSSEDATDPCIIYGCTDNTMFNHNPKANQEEDPSSCIAVFGRV